MSFAGGVFPANVTIDHTIPREDEFANYVDWIRKLHSKYIDTMPHPDFNPIAPVSEFGVHTAPTMHSAVINAAGYLLGFRNKILPQLRKLCATLPLPTLDGAMIHLWNEYRLTCPDAMSADRGKHRVLTPSADFRSMNWDGVFFEFSTSQAACVHTMYRSWEDGVPVLSDFHILEESGLGGSRLSDVFQKGKHPAWGNLIVPGQTKGTRRLKPEPPN